MPVARGVKELKLNQLGSMIKETPEQNRQFTYADTPNLQQRGFMHPSYEGCLAEIINLKHYHLMFSNPFFLF